MQNLMGTFFGSKKATKREPCSRYRTRFLHKVYVEYHFCNGILVSAPVTNSEVLSFIPKRFFLRNISLPAIII